VETRKTSDQGLALPGSRLTNVVGPVNSPAEGGGPALTVPDAPLAFHVMAKPTGAVCKLDCE